MLSSLFIFPAKFLFFRGLDTREYDLFSLKELELREPNGKGTGLFCSSGFMTLLLEFLHEYKGSFLISIFDLETLEVIHSLPIFKIHRILLSASLNK
jgi:hypothetical protein